MKIEKKFVDLIYNGEKKYEFRNSDDKEGIYKIKDKFFKLTYVYDTYYPFIREEFINPDNKYWINSYEATAEEAEWIRENILQFKEKDKYKIYFYKWTEVDYEKHKLKKLKIVGE